MKVPHYLQPYEPTGNAFVFFYRELIGRIDDTLNLFLSLQAKNRDHFFLETFLFRAAQEEAAALGRGLQLKSSVWTVRPINERNKRLKL